jgi:hypothetical protein
VIKLGILYYAYQAKHSFAFTALLAVFALHNTAEVMSLVQFNMHLESANFVARGYYAVSVWALVFMLNYAHFTVYRIGLPKRRLFSLFGCALVFSGLLFFTNSIVTGSVATGITIAATRGELYFLFQVIVLLGMGSFLFTLVNGLVTARDASTEIRCWYSLLALLPIVLLSVGIVLLQFVGINFTATLLMPIFSTIFLLVSLYYESVHRVTDIRMYLPFSIERSVSSNIMATCSDFSSNKVSFREAHDQLEKELVLYSLRKNGFNVSKSAEAMALNRTTLYSILKRHGISDLDTKRVNE